MLIARNVVIHGYGMSWWFLAEGMSLIQLNILVCPAIDMSSVFTQALWRLMTGLKACGIELPVLKTVTGCCGNAKTIFGGCLSCPTPSFSVTAKIQHHPNQVVIFLLCVSRLVVKQFPFIPVKEAHRGMRPGHSAALTWSVTSSVLSSGN